MEVRHLHAPRTGGTALAWALRGTRVKRCGHSVRLVDLDPADRVVTTVRDPVARFASTWGWLRRAGYAVASPEELLAARSYIVSPGLDLLRPQSWWLGPPALLHRRALWVGRTEHLGEDYPRLRAELGGGDLPPRGHASRNESEHPPLTPDTIAAIRERYAEDHLLLEDTGPMPKSPKVVTVVPSPDLPPMSYVRGVPARGKTLPLDEAQPLLDAGLVIIKPDDKPDKKQADETATEKEA